MSSTDAELAVSAAEAGTAVVRARFGADLARVDKGGGDFAAEISAWRTPSARARRGGAPLHPHPLNTAPAPPAAMAFTTGTGHRRRFPTPPAFRAARLLTEPAFEARFRPRALSTTLALAWVATGRRSAYVTDGDLRDSVHFAAGIALREAAGCVVSGLRDDPVLTGPGGLIAGTHAALVELTSGPAL